MYAYSCSMSILPSSPPYIFKHSCPSLIADEISYFNASLYIARSRCPTNRFWLLVRVISIRFLQLLYQRNISLLRLFRRHLLVDELLPRFLFRFALRGRTTQSVFI